MRRKQKSKSEKPPCRLAKGVFPFHRFIILTIEETQGHLNKVLKHFLWD